MNSGSQSHDNHRRVAVAIAIKVKGQAHLAVISDLGMNVQNSSVLLAGDRPTFPLENNVWIDAKFWDTNLSFLLILILLNSLFKPEHVTDSPADRTVLIWPL